MKSVSLFVLNYIGCFLIYQIDAYYTNRIITFPLVYKWTKRTKEDIQACIDPTEPFQCPGTNVCISLQFLCDGHIGDCPNGYDEDQSLCVAYRRPPKDSIRRFLSAQYTHYGTTFIEYLFGTKAASLFSKKPHLKAIEIISISLAVSPTIDDFAKVLEMTDSEKKRLANLLESVNTGQVSSLPQFIVDSISEGLSTLANNLIKTQFLQAEQLD